MARNDTIEVEGTVTECLPNTTFRVQVPNGHDLVAHVADEMRVRVTGMLPGAKVVLQVTPYDFSKGRIIDRQ